MSNQIQLQNKKEEQEVDRRVRPNATEAGEEFLSPALLSSDFSGEGVLAFSSYCCGCGRGRFTDRGKYCGDCIKTRKKKAALATNRKKDAEKIKVLRLIFSAPRARRKNASKKTM